MGPSVLKEISLDHKEGMSFRLTKRDENIHTLSLTSVSASLQRLSLTNVDSVCFSWQPLQKKIKKNFS
jgi:hypothetical protein